MNAEEAEKIRGMIPGVFDRMNPPELMPGSEIYDYYVWRRVDGDIESLNSISNVETLNERLEEIAVEYLLLCNRVENGAATASDFMKCEEYQLLIDTFGIGDVVARVRLEMGR